VRSWRRHRRTERRKESTHRTHRTGRRTWGRPRRKVPGRSVVVDGVVDFLRALEIAFQYF